MIKTINLKSEKTLTLKSSLGFRVRFQANFGKPCDQALVEMEKSADTTVLLQLAYCMAEPKPTEDFEHFCDGLDGADLMPISNAVIELYSNGLPTEKQIKKAKN